MAKDINMLSYLPDSVKIWLTSVNPFHPNYGRTFLSA